MKPPHSKGERWNLHILKERDEPVHILKERDGTFHIVIKCFVLFLTGNVPLKYDFSRSSLKRDLLHSMLSVTRSFHILKE
jgi:hypothetical protein